MRNRLLNLILLIVSLILFFYFETTLLKVIFGVNILIVLLQILFHSKIDRFENKIDNKISEETASTDSGGKNIPFVATQIVIVIEIIIFLVCLYMFFLSEYAMLWKILAILVSIFILGKWTLTYRIIKLQQRKSP
jgi:hypothetical protein